MVGNEKCLIKTHFKRWVTFEIIMTNPKLSDEVKAGAILPLCLKKLPSGVDVALQACMNFYSGGKSENKPGKSLIKPVYSFLYDSELIYSAFMSQYGIDLARSDMHWYKFKALFKGLEPSNTIVQVMQMRNMNLSEIKDDNLRRKYREMKEIWALPDLRSDRQKEKDIVRAFEKTI